MPSPTDKLDDLHGKVDAVLNILRGGHDAASGKYTAGLSPRMDLAEEDIRQLKQAAEQAENRQLNARHAVGLSLLGAFLGQALGWARDHIK